MVFILKPLQYCKVISLHIIKIKKIIIKCGTQYVSKFGKHSSGHRTGKGQLSFQSQKGQCQRMFKLPSIALISYPSKLGLSSM